MSHPHEYVRIALQIPETLRRRIELFGSNGRIFLEANEMFAEPSWMQVMRGQRGQRGHPRSYHALVDVYSEQKIAEYREGSRGVIGNGVRAMPTHEAFMARHCATQARAAA